MQAISPFLTMFSTALISLAGQNVALCGNGFYHNVFYPIELKFHHQGPLFICHVQASTCTFNLDNSVIWCFSLIRDCRFHANNKHQNVSVLNLLFVEKQKNIQL